MDFYILDGIAMGNIPLCLPRKGELVFGEYGSGTAGRFSLKSYHPYDMSIEDLRPIMSREGGELVDNDTILGVEMDQDMVWRKRMI